MPKDISRRTFLSAIFASITALLGSSYFIFWRREKIAGSIVGPNKAIGHKLRGRKFKLSSNAPSNKVDTLIIGGGISGLSAGWWLQKSGYKNFQIIDLEKQIGGNAKYGVTARQEYPWGAHYLPLPNPETNYVRLLLEEMGIKKGQKYDETVLCEEPLERLFIYNRWQGSIFPSLGARDSTLKERERFQKHIQNYRAMRGNDGKKAFAIPLDLSSKDFQITKLDQISFAAYLKKHNFTSKRLLWYLNYCCLDDYGATLENTSAWAGIHYFAARPAETRNLVWPNGNGEIVKHLKMKLNEHIKTEMTAFAIEKIDKEFHASIDSNGNSSVIKSEKLIFAAPKFLIPYVFIGKEKEKRFKSMVYSPWMVANVHLRSLEQLDFQPYWDNVIYQGRGLGFINNQHQVITANHGEAVFTYYHPFGGKNTLKSRLRLYNMGHAEASGIVLEDLERPYPNVREHIKKIDFYFWAHAMIRPYPGYIMKERKTLKPFEKNLFFAHSDMSGISIFEEAQFQGVQAAKALLRC